MLVTIPADVTKRLPILLIVLALVTAACGSIPEGEVVAGEGDRFVPFVAEFLDDSGLGNSMAVDSEGVPVMSYLIFPAVLEEGEIPVGRPLGAAYITTDDEKPKDGAAVGVASLSAEGVWTRGAMAQVRETPDGVYIPYGPAVEPSLVGATAENTNGTDIAVDDAGTTHVVWAGKGGISYASGTDSATVEPVFDYDFSLRKAGPIGRPGVAVDADGNPWVAYTVSAGGQQVRVAMKSGDKWRTQTVATVPQCADCPPPRPTQIGVTSAGPTVAWVDNGAGAVMVSVLDGTEWVSTEVARGGQGLDMTVDADGNALLTFYDAQGAVQLARPDGAGWSVSTIADAAPTDLETLGNLASMTSIAVDDEGVMAAAWDDADGVVLATSEDGETFTPVETPDTFGGRTPSAGVSPDGSKIFLAWYDPESQNLRFGVQGDMGELAVAAPSPTIDPAEMPTAAPSDGGGECGADGQILLDIVAEGIAWTPTCLVAPAGEPFTITMDNRDAGTQHNVAIAADSDFADFLFTGSLETGPAVVEYEVDPLDAGPYPFRCDVHPTMLGTLAVVEAGGGSDGGGGGGNGNAS
jgi:plastocyanin